jgi:thiol:disulfide interchange protein
MNELAGWRRSLGPCGPLAALLLALGATAAFAADPPAASPASAPANGLDAVVAQSRASSGDNDVLPPDQAFRFAAFPDGPDRVRLVWKIADDYYLYRSRIKIETSSNRAQLGTPQMPAGEVKQDDYFGRQEIYHHQLAASVPVARAAPIKGAEGESATRPSSRP